MDDIREQEGGVREGPARVFVPVCKHPRDYPQSCLAGPLGYIEADPIQSPDPGPIFVRPPRPLSLREPELAAGIDRCREALGELIQARRAVQ